MIDPVINAAFLWWLLVYSLQRTRRMQEQIDKDERTLWGVVHNARRPPGRAPLWVKVRRATGLGSTSADELCRRFNKDPDEVVGTEGE